MLSDSIIHIHARNAASTVLPTGVNKWLFHQTCEKGKGREVGVGSYYVDQNRFNGTRELTLYFGRGTHNVYLPIVTVPEPEPVEDDWTGLAESEVVVAKRYPLGQ